MSPPLNPKSKIQNFKFALLAALAALALLAVPAARAVVTVSNLAVAQRPGTKLVDITYDVASDASSMVTVSLVVSNGTAVVLCPSVSGAVGPGVSTGTGKAIVWDMGADWNGSVASGVKLRVTADDGWVPPVSDMALIPAGSFNMGDNYNDGSSNDRPVHSVTVSAFYMDKYEVTKAKWDEVANWAAANGYDINEAGASGKAPNHPALNVTWYECAKWCNARSQKEWLSPCYTVGATTYKTGSSAPVCDWSANGYRLPTEAEWEKAARGGLSGWRFPSSGTIQHALANYYSTSSYLYDTSPTRGYHPTYTTGGVPYTSPVGAFAANGYGLYDMAGNVNEWCWDWRSDTYYGTSPGIDPRGPSSGSTRVLRGGGWEHFTCRVAERAYDSPSSTTYADVLGFRSVRTAP